MQLADEVLMHSFLEPDEDAQELRIRVRITENKKGRNREFKRLNIH